MIKVLKKEKKEINQHPNEWYNIMGTDLQLYEKHSHTLVRGILCCCTRA